MKIYLAQCLTLNKREMSMSVSICNVQSSNKLSSYVEIMQHFLLVPLIWLSALTFSIFNSFSLRILFGCGFLIHF